MSPTDMDWCRDVRSRWRAARRGTRSSAPCRRPSHLPGVAPNHRETVRVVRVTPEVPLSLTRPGVGSDIELTDLMGMRAPTARNPLEAAYENMPDQIWVLLLVGLISFLFNVTPVLAPPTWALLVYFQARQDSPIVVVALIGAVGATAGRVALALVSRKIGMRIIPARRRVDAERATDYIRRNPKLSAPMLAMFAIGPLPKALLFMAVGIMRAPLVPGALVYGVARLGMYLVALTAASRTVASLGDLFAFPFGGPLLVCLQFASVIGLFLFFRLDLPRLIQRVRNWQGAPARDVIQTTAESSLASGRRSRHPAFGRWRTYRSR